MSKVAVVRCESYAHEAVQKAIQTGFKLLGGTETFVSDGEKILLKPNILSGAPPEKCIGPHPIVFRAIAEELRKTNVRLSFGDSPGFGSSIGNARKAGFMDVAESLQIPFADFDNAITLQNPAGKLINKFEIAKGVAESDGLISISKLKTHALTRITGAIKNQFGCIPGPRKAEFHSVMPNAVQFSRMLVDLNLLLTPRLYIMDGIMAMEGNGPRNGTPVAMNVLLFSTDPVALDATVCNLIDLDINLVEPIKLGGEMGLGSYSNIEYLGDAVEQFNNPVFKANRSPVPTTEDTSFLSSTFMRKYTAPQPTINSDNCTRCGTCVSVCPAEPKALSWVDEERKKAPQYDYAKCIRCYCCQELCPEDAIYVKIPLLGKIIHA